MMDEVILEDLLDIVDLYGVELQDINHDWLFSIE